jgi:hypothetical protein
MSPRLKRKLIPPNPLERNETIPSIITAKRVWRLMLKEGRLPVYREVELTEDLLREICEHERHLTRVFIISDKIKRGEKVDSEREVELEVEPPEKIAGALEDLRAEYGGRRPRLDVEFIEKAHDAIQEQYWKEFLTPYPDPTSPEEYYHNGNIYTTKEDIASALMCYSKSIADDPRNPTFHFGRAQCYFMDGNDARSAFEDIENAMQFTKPTHYHQLLTQHFLRSKVCHALLDTEGMMVSLRTSEGIFRHLLEDFEADAGGWFHLGNGAMENAVSIKRSLEDFLGFTSKLLKDEQCLECWAELQHVLREYRRMDDLL